MKLCRQAFIAGAIAAAAAASGASAAPTIFFGEDLSNNGPLTSHPQSDAARASFFNNLTGVGTETFESYAAGTTFPLSINFSGAGTAVLTGTGDIESGPSTSDQYPISGTKYLNTTGTFLLNFTSPISAFGFYGTDIGDVGASLTLTLTGSNGVTTLAVPNFVGPAADGSALYFGFYDTANTYTSISFAGAGNDVFGFDDFSIGSRTQITPVTPSVPEMSTWAMLMLGMGAVGATLRRRSAIKAHFVAA